MRRDGTVRQILPPAGLGEYAAAAIDTGATH